MKRSKFIGHFDLDVSLRDEALDPLNRATKRMIANAAIGVPPEDAYYSTRELREAVEWVHEGMEGGKRKLTMILGNRCDDFQRCLYYALAGRGVIEMMDDLIWLEQLLEARGRIAGVIHRKKLQQMPLVKPYIAPEPDGVVPASTADFKEGPSWWMTADMPYDGKHPFD